MCEDEEDLYGEEVTDVFIPDNCVGFFIHVNPATFVLEVRQAVFVQEDSSGSDESIYIMELGRRVANKLGEVVASIVGEMDEQAKEFSSVVKEGNITYIKFPSSKAVH